MDQQCLRIFQMSTATTLFQTLDVREMERLTCRKCRGILIQPQQTACGCRFCHQCVKHLIESNEKYCPGCKESTNLTQENVVPDKAIEREMLNLKIKCKFQGCDFYCKVKELSHHLQLCKYRDVTCARCNEVYTVHNREEHLAVTCKMLNISCNHCGLEMTKNDFENQHRNGNASIDLLCEKWRDVCPFYCNEEVHQNLKDHLRVCLNKPIECRMKGIGCGKIVPRNKIESHLKRDVGNHMVMMTELLRNLKEELADMSKSIASEKEIDLGITKIKESLSLSSNDIEVLRPKLLVCEEMNRELINEVDIIKRSFTFRMKPISLKPNDIFRWRIDNITTKINDAGKGNNKTIFSEPFYSSASGYKMCLKMYPNGDGVALGKFISLYFVIMKGEYDNYLRWPFARKVSLSLGNNGKNIPESTQTLKPDSNDRCYGKPNSTFNLAAGIPFFINHTHLIGSEDGRDDGDYIVVRATVEP